MLTLKVYMEKINLKILLEEASKVFTAKNLFLFKQALCGQPADFGRR